MEMKMVHIDPSNDNIEKYRKKKSISGALKAPKLYKHETRIAQKAAGGVGGAVSPLAGAWKGPGGGEVPENILAFWRPKDIKTA